MVYDNIVEDVDKLSHKQVGASRSHLISTMGANSAYLSSALKTADRGQGDSLAFNKLCDLLRAN